MDSDCVLAWLLGFMLGAAIFGCNQDRHWEREAVRHGAAFYDLKTGQFAWKESQ